MLVEHLLFNLLINYIFYYFNVTNFAQRYQRFSDNQFKAQIYRHAYRAEP